MLSRPVFALLACFLLAAACPFTAAQPEEPAPADRQAGALEAQDVAAARALVQRITPGVAEAVFLRLDATLPGFRVSRYGREGVLIEAGDAARLIAGYGHYLKFVAGCHLSWNGDRIDLKLPLPAPDVPLTVGPNPWKIRFAFNYCALSYSAAFWDWPRWERELDFLALQGFTHVFVTAGLEQVWTEVLEQMGCRPDTVTSFIAHPAYAAWWHMGNLEGAGGPVSRDLARRQALLGRRIAMRARQLGMNPVIQGYMGFLPSRHVTSMILSFPQGSWCGYPRPSLVHPTCNSIFQTTASRWYRAVEHVYDFRPAWFAGDLFHEGGRRGEIDEKEMVNAVRQAMQRAAPGSTWVLQAWGGNPSAAFLESLDPGHTLILNLVKDMHGGDAPGRDFGGIPWLWCELANFGGNDGLYGGLPLMARLGPALARQRERGLAGLGLLSEGIGTNPLYYDFFFSRLSTDRPFCLDAELPLYARRRYGSENPHLTEALTLLAAGLYNPDRQQEGCSESIVCARPGWLVDKASTWSTANRYYDPADTLRAARLLLEAVAEEPALGNLDTFRYDLADVVRQVLADAAYDQLQCVKAAYEARSLPDYDRESASFLALLRDLDSLLSTERSFRLSTWTNAAAAMGKTPQEAAAQKALARQLVTTWSGNIQGLNDYSNRQWAGLISRFYLPRWELFFQSFRPVIAAHTAPDAAAAAFAEACHAFELAFPAREERPGNNSEAAQDTVSRAARVLAAHRDRLDRLARSSSGSGSLRWEIPRGATEATRDVTDRINRAGFYRISAAAGSGARPGWLSASLFEGDTEVARAPLDNSGNATLRLPALRTGLDTYTLRLRLASPATAPVQGTLTLRPVP